MSIIKKKIRFCFDLKSIVSDGGIDQRNRELKNYIQGLRSLKDLRIGWIRNLVERGFLLIVTTINNIELIIRIVYP